MFAIAFDGFVQNPRYSTLIEAKEKWQQYVRNTLLYQYDCSVYELNTDGTTKRRVSYEELK